MVLYEAVRALCQRLGWWSRAPHRRWQAGTTDAADARRIADAERAAGGVPDGCAWLDERTIADVDLPLVFRALDRTVTPTGAQALWRWLAAPTVRVDVLAARERSLARLAARAALRDQLRDALAGHATVDAPQLPRLLWEPPRSPSHTGVFIALAAAVVVLGALAAWWPPLAIGGVLLFLANVWIDDWASLRLAPPGAVGNDLALDAGLVVTGSNMSGKSTFLRTIAINAICAQSIHTTFGTWTASMVRVFAVMRIADATGDGMSTYAVEVAAVGQVIEAVAPRDHEVPALLVIDEPFRGTNPALRVPIVVSVLDYLGERDIVVAATHDLDVAAQVDARFARGYFAEPDGERGRFDHKLRSGVSPSSNALALLVRAGYPPAIIAAAERRASAGRAGHARGS